ncbi:hypothetical protein M407DRAFT_244901, partial [Tulasnella calospora MUT 4182]
MVRPYVRRGSGDPGSGEDVKPFHEASASAPLLPVHSASSPNSSPSSAEITADYVYNKVPDCDKN